MLCFGVEVLEMEGVEGIPDGCVTPKDGECQIPTAVICPPPPKKKIPLGKRSDPPKNGYFQPPELDALFATLPRREACV